MTTYDDDITVWISRLRDVDQDAAHQLWMVYFPKLVTLARGKLRSHPRRHADEEDVALSALNSFFRGAEAGRFDINDRHDLWKLLTTITLRKVSAEYRRTYAEKRGGGTVSGESAFERLGENGTAYEGLAEVVLDENKMPELAEDVVSMCEELLQKLGDDQLQQTALLKMEGYTHREIADSLGCSTSRVKQRLARIRDKWSRFAE